MPAEEKPGSQTSHGAEGESPSAFFVHPLHFHVCAMLPSMMVRGMAGMSEDAAIEQSVKKAVKSYTKTEDAIRSLSKDQKDQGLFQKTDGE